MEARRSAGRNIGGDERDGRLRGIDGWGPGHCGEQLERACEELYVDFVIIKFL
jgi:hypothetical protein